jgi:predicted metal-dependent hydrolase
VAEFNAEKYYQCHETLEHLWLQERDPVRYLYQGILQVGVGLYHLDRGNWRGAVNKLEDGLAKLEVFRPHCQGFDIERLVVAAAGCRQALLEGGPGAVEGFDRGAYPKIQRL